MFNTINESVSWKYEIYGSNQDEIFKEHFYLRYFVEWLIQNYASKLFLTVSVFKLL